MLVVLYRVVGLKREVEEDRKEQKLEARRGRARSRLKRGSVSARKVNFAYVREECRRVRLDYNFSIEIDYSLWFYLSFTRRPSTG